MKTLIAALFAGGMIALAPVANADVTPAQICGRLDASPTKSEILDIMVEEFADPDETPEEVASRFAMAALITCPRHELLIDQAMLEFSQGDFT